MYAICFKEKKMDEILVNTSSVAKFCGCSVRTIRRAIEKNEMPQPFQTGDGKRPNKTWLKKDLEFFRDTIIKRKKHTPKKYL